MASSRKILLIDYDPESIESTRGPLLRAGYEVEVASDGIAGIEAFERLKPDLVLIEPMVPKKHGFQVCQEIKSTPAGRDTPVLITTGFYRGRKHRDEARESYGCDDYLEKPIAEELLLSTCDKFLIDTQEPPIPVTDEPGASVSLAIPASELSSADSGTGLVDSLPDLPVPGEKKTSRLQALDDLTEDEIQERLDAMIIGFELPPAPETPVVAVEPPPVEVTQTGPEAAGTVEPVGAIPETPPAESVRPDEIVPLSGGSPTPVAETPPVSREVEPSTAQSSEATVESLLSRQPSHRSAPVAAEQPASAVEPEVPSHAVIESPSRSRTPLWIGIAAGLFIVVGISILWILRDQGDADPSIDTASISIGQGTPKPAPVPTNPSPMRLPGVPVSEVAESDLVGEVAAASESDAAVVASTDTAEPLETSAATSAMAGETANAPETRTANPPAPIEPSPSSSTGDVPTEPAAAAAAVTAEVPSKAAEAMEDTLAAGATERAISEPDPEPEVDSTEAAEASTEGAAPESATPEPVIEETLPTTSPVAPAVVESPIVPVLMPEEETTSAPPAAPPAPKTRRGDLVDLAELDQIPVVKDKAMPDYPPAALSMRLEGTVNLRLLVDERGRVEQVEIDSGTKSKQLQRAARQAAERWVYQPGVKDGVPVKVWVPAAVNFKL